MEVLHGIQPGHKRSVAELGEDLAWVTGNGQVGLGGKVGEALDVNAHSRVLVPHAPLLVPAAVLVPIASASAIRTVDRSRHDVVEVKVIVNNLSEGFRVGWRVRRGERPRCHALAIHKHVVFGIVLRPRTTAPLAFVALGWGCINIFVATVPQTDSVYLARRVRERAVLDGGVILLVGDFVLLSWATCDMRYTKRVLELVGRNLHSTAGAAVYIKVRAELSIAPSVRAKGCLATDEACLEGKSFVERIPFGFHVEGLLRVSHEDVDHTILREINVVRHGGSARVGVPRGPALLVLVDTHFHEHELDHLTPLLQMLIHGNGHVLHVQQGVTSVVHGVTDVSSLIARCMGADVPAELVIIGLPAFGDIRVHLRAKLEVAPVGERHHIDGYLVRSEVSQGCVVGVLLSTETSVGIRIVPETGDWPLVSVGEPSFHKVRDGSGVGFLSHG
mmetsp:Transcript_18617/g.34514  ORF Transcript_18617/g.34514 Transcript_18617/m.34514 type:complete len:446 (+) Transcript_18617:1249-2586(+)